MADSHQFVTGPVHFFIGRGTERFYLGTAESKPLVREMPIYEEVHNDLAGASPFDLLFAGNKGLVVAKINRFQYETYNIMRSRPRHRPEQDETRPGRNSRLDVGALSIGNGLALSLTLQFSFFGTANAFPGLPPGYHFFASELVGPDDVDPGSAVLGVQCVWACTRVFNRQTRGFDLYSEDPALFQNLEQLIN